jgi:hypothetical protein
MLSSNQSNYLHPFTAAHYRTILVAALESGYRFALFGEPVDGRVIYLRHDVDNSIGDALKIAQIERDLGVRSTYLFLLRSQNYNLLCGVGISQIREIAALGHDVGLHHSCEPGEALQNDESLADRIRGDAALLSQQIGLPVRHFSLHNPAENDNFELDVPGLTNTYSAPYFREVKYLSESNFRWREGCPCELFRRQIYEKLQVLVHPMSYCEDLSGDRDALLYFLHQKIQLLSRVNQEQNRTLREYPVSMAEIAEHLKSHT